MLTYFWGMVAYFLFGGWEHGLIGEDGSKSLRG